MKTCKHKKRIQIYLDGWMDGSEASNFEKHLKKCSVCQSELMELEDISSSALEIVDEAPDRNYWDSFFARTLNRITSRNITPYESTENSRRGLRLKIGSYSLAIVSLAAIVLLTVNYLPDVLSKLAYERANRELAVEQTEPASEINIADNAQPVGQSVSRKIDQEPSDEIQATADSDPVETGFASVESEQVDQPGGPPPADDAIMAYFSDNVVADIPEPVLSNLSVTSRGPAKTEFDKINEDYRLSSSMIAAGILSEVNDKGDNTGSVEWNIEFSNFDNGFGNAANRISSDWGYLSMPPDSGNTGEFRRYLIELELIEIK